MASTQQNAGTNISSEAYDLLDCFVCGLDKVVYEIAADIAKSRSLNATQVGPVQIEAEDVEAAGKRVIDAVKKATQQGTHTELATIIGDVEQCFAWRQQKAR